MLVLCLATPVWAGKAHDHGVAAFGITVELARLTLQLDPPHGSLPGVERTPRTDGARGAADAVVAAPRAADNLFRVDPAAGDQLGGVELVAAALKRGPSAAAPAPVAEGDADLDASCRFNRHPGAKAADNAVELFIAVARLARPNVQLAGAQSQQTPTLRRPAMRLPLQGCTW